MSFAAKPPDDPGKSGSADDFGPLDPVETAVRQLGGASSGSQTTAHPDLDQLSAYHEDRLSEDDAEAVAEHLADCADCTAFVLDLGQFEGDLESPPTVEEFQQATAWKEFRSQKNQIEADEAAAHQEALQSNRFDSTRSSSISPTSPTSPTSWASPWWRSAAAALLVACLGLGAVALQQRQRAEDLENRLAASEAPQSNVTILYLDPITRSEETPATTLSTDERLVLIVTPSFGSSESSETSSASVGARLLDSEGLNLWETKLAPISEFGTLRLSLPRSLLPAGDYRLELFDPADQGSLGTYPFSITATAEAGEP